MLKARRKRKKEGEGGGAAIAPAPLDCRVVKGWDVAVLLICCVPATAALSRGEYLWTDTAEIGDRRMIRTSLASLFDACVHGIQGYYYRPTVFVLHSFNFVLFGDSPLAFRAVNLAVHAACALLVYLLAARLIRERRVALAAAALFAVHPLCVTPIAWVSDRTDLLALLCSLAFFLLAERYARRPRARTLAAAGACLTTGLFAKETPAVTLAITGVILIGVPPDRRAAWIRVGAVQVGAVALYFLWRAHVADNAIVVSRPIALVPRLALASSIHFEYLFQLLVPVELTTCDGRRVPTNPSPWIAASASVLALLALLVRRGWRARSWEWLVPLAWAGAFLAPTCGLVSLKHVRSDRYLYTALPALVLLGVWGARHRIPSSRARVAACAAVYVYFAASLLVRAPRYASNDALWTFETAKDDVCMEGFLHLARKALMEGRYDEVLRYADKIVFDRQAEIVAFTDEAATRFYRGRSLEETGNVAAARAQFQDLASSAVNARLRGESAYELGVLAFDAGNYDTAWRRMGDALSIGLTDPSRADALLLRAYAGTKLRYFDSSRHVFAQYLALSEHARKSPMRDQMANELRAALREGKP